MLHILSSHSGNSRNNNYRDEVIQALEAYSARQFRKGTVTFTVFVTADQKLSINLSCHNLNFGNYWGGEWLSNWHVDSNTSEISGHIRVHNHYFETGNIQFNLNKDVTQGKLTTVTGKTIVDFIAKSETKVRKEDDICSIKKGWRRCMKKYRRSY